ncbi:tRNA (N6-threonylcarbamoyladenosine(37)-N6)-methyltransferase TrmO [Halopseudomonas nanhaiensis]|uniref:tRNA (N6-threonylcarbamoyladenosine(37)-N6)-methyltransferase TrmO n=1 Tax=Halopseudomonas nanhaiensis TaxID=2830842 RepID=UPI001CBE1E8B|nr:tRNA (N6-threonylcarbamoyladenosine(37)-N6)-methyltransferase TrmO [Halopseudomonas nanhaiensis]UAW98388.1 tRNA (N6-threonylcarbamoyladenosine(37)-N6)-methyltransferase TrmO [Halopseudomonas nanhaiensis]
MVERLYTFEPVGVVRSCFAEKFAIPRQPRLAPAARGVVELLPPYDQPEALDGLEQASHLWLLFVFHAAPSGPDHLRVRPPRLGGNRRIGVFASRATHRPNPIGQSVVRLDAVAGGRLHVSGIDLLDGTPVLDIKPYVPYADLVADAHYGLAEAAPRLLSVRWQGEALEAARIHGQRLGEPVLELIEQCLAQDPKPAYQRPAPDREYGVRLWDLNVRWHYPDAGQICVLAVSKV